MGKLPAKSSKRSRTFFSGVTAILGDGPTSVESYSSGNLATTAAMVSSVGGTLSAPHKATFTNSFTARR